MATQIKLIGAVKQYKTYWDNWQKEWYKFQNVKAMPAIKDWPIRKDNGETNT